MMMDMMMQRSLQMRELEAHISGMRVQEAVAIRPLVAEPAILIEDRYQGIGLAWCCSQAVRETTNVSVQLSAISRQLLTFSDRSRPNLGANARMKPVT